MPNPANNRLNLGKSAATGLTRGKAALLRPDDIDAAVAERCKMLLRCRVLEHLRVHRWAYDERRARSQRSQADHLLREAKRQPRDNSGRSRRDYEQFRLPDQRYVPLSEV